MGRRVLCNLRIPHHVELAQQPAARDYFAARSLRILPGLWVCLVITAFVIARVSMAILGGPAAKLLLSPAPIVFALKNSSVVWVRPDVGGTPRGIPWPHGWAVLSGPSYGSYSATSLLLVSALSLSSSPLACSCGVGTGAVLSALLPPLSIFADAPAPHHTSTLRGSRTPGAIAAHFASCFSWGTAVSVPEHHSRSMVPCRGSRGSGSSFYAVA